MSSYDEESLRRDFYKLKEKYEILKEENIQLRKALRKEDGWSPSIKLSKILSPSESFILTYIFNYKDYAPLKKIEEALYYFKNDNVPEWNIISVFISKVNKKLKPFDAKIECVRGRGYYLSDESKKIISEI